MQIFLAQERSVRLARPFEILKRKVTRRQFSEFLTMFPKGRGKYDSRADIPVTDVSWIDAIQFCNWLNRAETGKDSYPMDDDGSIGLRHAGARYFLPNEDEWYKAAYFKPDTLRYVLFEDDGRSPSKVGVGLPDGVSPSGVEEMGSMVWEWTESPVGDLFRGLRSGSWFQGNNRQAAGRFYSNPDLRLPTIGFRIARSID